MKYKLDPLAPTGIAPDDPKQDYKPYFAGGPGKPSLLDSVNGKHGAVQIVGGTNVTVNNAGKEIVISATGGGDAGLSQTSADARYVAKSGDTMTGDLIIDDPTGTKSLELLSDNSGGLNTSDSTGRIQLHSYQRAQLNNDDHTNTDQAHYGEVLRIDLEHQQAKGAIAIRENYLGSGHPRTVAWMVAHGEANDSTPENPSWHNHFSIEIPDDTGALQTALEFPFGQFNVPNSFGLPLASHYVRSVNRLIAASDIRVEAANASNKNIYFASTTYNDDAGKRWGVQTDSTTESGSNVGSDFRINAYNDSGTFTRSDVFIRRSNGQIGIGNITNPAARLDASAAGSYPTIQATQTTASTVIVPLLSLVLGAVANRLLEGKVSGDTTARLTVFGNGKIEWGDGTNTRDTNLYRSSAGVLQTDQTLKVTTGLDTSATNIITDTTTGTKIGTSTTQKLGFYNATPVVQQAANVDIGTVLANLGLRASGTTYPITTSGTLSLTGQVALGTGGLRSNPSPIRTGATTLTSTSAYVERCDASTGAFTLTLPAASAAAGQMFIVKKIDSSANAVTISRAGTDLIDGATTYALSTQYKYVQLVNDGSSNWYVIGNN